MSNPYDPPQPQNPYGNDQQPPAPGQAQSYGQQDPAYGQQAGGYGQAAAPYGHQVPMRPPHGFMPAVKAFFRNYATFYGRANKGEYWWAFLFLNIVIWGLYIVLAILGGIAMAAAYNSADGGAAAGGLVGILGLLLWLVALGLAVPSYAVGARRMHDVNQSGWMILIPIYNLVLMLGDSDPAGARFDDPSGKQPRLGTD